MWAGHKTIATCHDANLTVVLLWSPVAGIVEELSQLAREKSGLKQGDRVMALVGGGGYAGT